MRRVTRVVRRRRWIKKTRLQELFRNSVKKIRSALVERGTHECAEIDISKHYTRSMRTLGNYVTLDWQHREDIRILQKTIADYAEDKTRERPLNILMLAEPGSGKSHFIACLAAHTRDVPLSAVAFNMGTFRHVDDFVRPLDAVRNLKVVDKFPLLFLDEFDSLPRAYRWLLPLLWDGELQVAHRDLKLGKLVIVLAGSNPNIRQVMKDARSMQIKASVQPDPKAKTNKLPDLLSRINGGVFEIPELEERKKSRDRRVDKICLSISLLQRRFGAELASVPWALLHFIAVTRFRYGVRSIAHLLDLIQAPPHQLDTLRPERVRLPLTSSKELRKSSLAYHLIAETEPDDIVELWTGLQRCKTLVRFKLENSEPAS